jgi:uncharacterized protein YjbI with pentapeptide repeats
MAADAFWLCCLALFFFLISLSTPVTKIVMLGSLLILILRFAHRIPGLRWFWVGLFGERTFWEWMTLLCAPILLSSIGLLISTSINRQQGDVAIVTQRLSITNEYYNRISELLLLPEFQTLVQQRVARPGPILANDMENCDPDRGSSLTSLGYTRTISVLRSLSNLKTSDEEYTPLKRGIVQLLYYSGLIQRRGHVVSLQQARLNNTDLSNIDLSGSCFDSVSFAGSNLSGTKLSNSNMRRSSLAGANMESAKLVFVNLSGGSDLRGVSARGAKMAYSDLDSGLLDRGIFQDAQFVGADFRDASLVDSDLRGALLVSADLRGADLSGADLRGAVLIRARIDSSTKLTGAIYSTVPLDNNARVDRRKKIVRILGPLRALFQIERFIPVRTRIDPTSFDPSFQRKSEMRLKNSI